MKNKKQILTTGLTVVISVFLVSLGVYAATTIGTDIETEGTLTVTGASTLTGAFTQTTTHSDNEYDTPFVSDWTVGADMAAGGAYVIHGKAHIDNSVQNVGGMRGVLYFDGLADVDEVVNQTRGVEGAVNLSTTKSVAVKDDISAIGGYLGPAATGNVTIAAGTAGTLSVVDLVYLPERNMSVETHGIKLTAKKWGSTGTGPQMDYGLRIQNQGISTANIYLENENYSTTAVVNDILMTSIVGDVTNGINMSGAVYSGSGIDIGIATNRLVFSGIVGGTATDGSLIKAGVPDTEMSSATADHKFLALYLKNTATSGDNRGIYNKLTLAGIGGGGESLRSYTEISGVAASTAHGAHISLGMGSGGSVTGLGIGVRATLGLPNGALTAGGTYAAMQPEIYSSGSSSDAGAVTELSVIRAVNGGNTAGMEDVDDDAFFISFEGFEEGAYDSGNMIMTGTTGVYAGSIRIKINNTTYYLPYHATPAQGVAP